MSKDESYMTREEQEIYHKLHLVKKIKTRTPVLTGQFLDRLSNSGLLVMPGYPSMLMNEGHTVYHTLRFRRAINKNGNHCEASKFVNNALISNPNAPRVPT
jgi:hypothetical protein